MNSNALFQYGQIGDFPVGNQQLPTYYSCCTYYETPLGYPANNIWSSIAGPINMETYDSCYVVADNYSSLNTNYTAVDFTDNGYESGYLSYGTCTKMFEYTLSDGVLSRLASSCVQINIDYDDGSGNGDCPYSEGETGGSF
jgi:hypothetical protein